MVSMTITVTTNADGSMTGSSASSPGVSFTTFSLKSLMDWALGLVQVTLGTTYPGVPS
jgi:hypothetical protein